MFIFSTFSKKIKHFKNFSRLCSFFQISFGGTYSHIFLCSFFRAHGSHAPMFFFLTKSASHYLTAFCCWSIAAAAAASTHVFARFYVVCFERLHRARNLCSRGPRGLKFFMHSHPLMGGRPPKFQQKIRRKKIFFCLISPTHYPAHNSCSKGPRGLKFVMRIDHPHVGPTTTFLF